MISCCCCFSCLIIILSFVEVSTHEWDHYEINLAIEEQRGAFVVVPFVHEEVDDQWVNGVAFGKLATIEEVLSGEIDSACTLVDGKKIEFVVPAVEPSLINMMPSWRKVMTKNVVEQKTKKLAETMSSFAIDAKALPPKKVYFNISNTDEDIELSNKFFTETKGGAKVDHIKIPFKHTTKIKNDQYESLHVLLIWRLCFTGTERPKGDGTQNNTKKSAIDEICDLMSGL